MMWQRGCAVLFAAILIGAVVSLMPIAPGSSSEPIKISIRTSSSDGPAPQTVTFSVTISGGAPPYTWTLDFGDGSAPATGTGNTITETHTYTTDGTFAAEFTAVDADKISSSLTSTVNIGGPKEPSVPTEPIKVSLKTIRSEEAPETITFSATISGGAPPYTWTLDFGDGSAPATGSGSTITETHTYTTDGTFAVKLTIVGADNTSASFSVNINVESKQEEASVPKEEEPQVPKEEEPPEIPSIGTATGTITLDRMVYSPFNRVHITLEAPSLNIDQSRSDLARLDITILPSNKRLQDYRLVETGFDTGTFSGYITLEGQTGSYGGSGPTDGRLPADRGDDLQIRFGSSEIKVPIDYSRGRIVWDKASYKIGDEATITLIDPDLDRIHHMKESAVLKLYASSIAIGEVEVTETDASSGNFAATLIFREKSMELSENEIGVEEGNEIFAGYMDDTMPLPNRITDERGGFTEGSELFGRTLITETEFHKEPTLKQTFVSGEVLVGLRDDVDLKSDEVLKIIEAAEGKIIEVIEEINVLRISVAKGKEQNVIEQLQKSGIVKFAGKNKYLVPTSIEVRDPDFSRQIKHYEMINLPDAWSISVGRSEVIVAVLDSGIDLDHPDLQGNTWKNDDSCDDGLDNDSNGFVDDCIGWNFVHSNNKSMDEGGSWPRCNGHGTHVAGIVGATSNEVGGLGVAPNVTIMPIKVSGEEDVEGDILCVSTEAIAAQAVVYAADNGADIINGSLGCPNGEKCEMPTLGDAFRYAFNKGVLIVVAAGNERETSEGIDDWQDYAQYVIETSSVDLSGELARYSNSGPGIKLSAPGTAVYSTKLDDRYGIKTGTSQAAPMVSGCAALLLSVDNSLTTSDLEKILGDSAKDIGDKGRDDFFGYGLLDCNQALNLTKKRVGLGLKEPDISVAMKHKKKVSLVAVKNNSDEEIFGVQMEIDDGKIRFVKARGWDRDRIDQQTVIVQTDDRPIKPGKSLIMILIVDNRTSSYEWKVNNSSDNIIATGDVTPRS